jgi:hypothetical protein
MRVFFSATVALILSVCASPAGAQENKSSSELDNGFTISTGFYYSSGKYGAALPTDVQVALTDLSYKTGSFRFSTSLPYLDIKGPAYSVIGSNNVPVLINPKAGSNTIGRSGLGDINIATTYSVPNEKLGDFDLDIMARVKLPTAGISSGLSTGATDFAFSTDLSYNIGAWSPFVSLGYNFFGQPTGYSLKNSASWSAGTSVQVSDKVFGILSYNYSEASSSSIANSHEIFASASWLSNDAITLTGYGEVGLSSGAPAIGMGLLVSWKIR